MYGSAIHRDQSSFRETWGCRVAAMGALTAATGWYLRQSKYQEVSKDLPQGSPVVDVEKAMREIQNADPLSVINVAEEMVVVGGLVGILSMLYASNYGALFSRGVKLGASGAVGIAVVYHILSRYSF